MNRQVDGFVQQKLNTATSGNAYQQTLLEFAKPVDNLLADPQGGLSSAMSDFFAAAQDLSTDPTSTAARQALISRGQSLADRFAQLEGQIDDQRTALNGRIGTTVAELNQLAQGVADLNQRIVDSRGSTGGRSPNDLLDQRDELVRQIAERVGASTVEQSDGTLNVYVGNGQALVVGSKATELVARASSTDPGTIEIGVSNGAAVVPVGKYLSGGSLGALLDVRSTVLDPTSQQLGRLALGIAQAVNQVHTGNMDLNGHAGGAFFGLPAPRVLADAGNSATGKPTVSVDDAGSLQASDYELRFTSGAWRLTRLNDGQVLGNLAPGDSLSVDGLTVDTSAISGAADGDRYLLQPTRVAGDLQVLVTDPRQVAAALPIRAEADAGNGGGATVEALSVTDASDPALRSAVQVDFTGGNFVVGGQTIAPDPSGDTVIEQNGWRLVIRGTPSEGDSFQVTDNAGGTGDNRGAQALADLASVQGQDGGTATFAESYSQLVTEVGVTTSRASLNADVQSRLLDEATSQRDSVSGVNLDEEAANLVRFQQAYQAAAQVVSTASSMFDSLLQAVRR